MKARAENRTFWAVETYVLVELPFPANDLEG
jgi:hypothetical protein